MNRKQIILTIFWLSLFPIIFGVNYASAVDLYSLVRLIGGMAGIWGILLLTWQMLLGLREFAGSLTSNLVWLNSLHKRIGKYGFLLIALHPTLIVVFYSSIGLNLLQPEFSTPFDIYKSLGTISFFTITLVWLMSALLRSKISFRWWKRLHLLPYFVMPLIFVHSFGLANILQGGLRYYWYLLVVIALALSIYRLLTAAGLLKFYYQVVGVTDVTPNVKRFILAPLGGKVMSPQPGQFLYIQTKRFGETHPFTISHLDNQTGELSITAKSAGYFTQQLHKLKAGDRVFITGPYGVFTREAYTTKRQIALVAGGIGITPFLQIIERLHGGWDQQITLFYGNRTIGDIAFGDYLNDLVQEYPEQLKLVNVLSGEPDYEGETGFVSLELIQRYLTEQTNSYEYFVCGPQVMMDKVSSALLAAGVPKAQVHMEKFSL